MVDFWLTGISAAAKSSHYGSMALKMAAACRFAKRQRIAAIGAVDAAAEVFAGRRGTEIYSNDASGADCARAIGCSGGRLRVAVQLAVAQRLVDMGKPNSFVAAEIGHRACQLQNPMIGPGGQA